MKIEPRFQAAAKAPFLIDAVEMQIEPRAGAIAAIIGQHLKLDLVGLKSYFFARWDVRLFDLLVVAAAVEFCDRVHRRPARGWARAFDVRVSVHEPEEWTKPDVCNGLEETLGFLTGDTWRFSFIARKHTESEAPQRSLSLPPGATLIMPYSEGLDSLAVHALMRETEQGGLVRVRLGAGGVDRNSVIKDRQPFARVPYHVRTQTRAEPSARARGFKFAVITAIAAAMSSVDRIVVTESGQGALGPVLVPTGHAYPDYRVHPAFTRRVERFFEALTGRAVRYVFPRLWSTKGETLAIAAALPQAPDWARTRSCWQSAQQVSVAGERRQCGVCAACMLRRMSMHSAGLEESATTYVWETLQTSEFRAGAAAEFQRHTSALDQYGIAGVLHLDHLAALSGSDLHRRHVRRVARETADALREDADDVESRLFSLLKRHAEEWRLFVLAQGGSSFVARYASSVTA